MRNQSQPSQSSISLHFCAFARSKNCVRFQSRERNPVDFEGVMLIRYGYEITLTCTQPTAMVCLLSVHDDHKRDIRVPEPA